MDFRCNLESPKPASRPYSELTDAVTDMNLSGGLFGYSSVNSIVKRNVPIRQ